MNIAFITGITGQDGSYLAEFLLDKKYLLFLTYIFNNFFLHHAYHHNRNIYQ